MSVRLIRSDSGAWIGNRALPDTARKLRRELTLNNFFHLTLHYRKTVFIIKILYPDIT